VLAQKLDPKISFEKISAQLVKAKEEQQLLWSLKAFYDSPTLTEELKFYKTDNDQEYKDLIDKYFNSDNKLFSEFVIKPEVTDALLRIKYNSDFYANQDAYNRAQDILNKIKSGQSFEDLAKTSSDDKVSGQLGGDLGFVASGQILPELETAMINAKLGEADPNMVISRLGYHILYPVETGTRDGQKVWHIKHILVKTSGFDSWLNLMLKQFWVWHIK
jgi:parvulin-like peptidyl-prolyl isomerase